MIIQYDTETQILTVGDFQYQLKSTYSGQYCMIQPTYNAGKDQNTIAEIIKDEIWCLFADIQKIQYEFPDVDFCEPTDEDILDTVYDMLD